MSEDKKDDTSAVTETKIEETNESTETNAKSSTPETKEPSKNKSGMTASELAAIAEAEAETAAARSRAAKEVAEKALEEEYKAAAKEAIIEKISDSFTNKRFQEQIFRREMGEPEFFLRKHELAPPRHILTPEEQEEISRRVEIPTDQTPKYNPQHMLSPEYHGTSPSSRRSKNYRLSL